MTFVTVLSVLTGIFAAAAIYAYLFGIPEEWKRALEKKALRAMGENKASYLVQSQISKIPADDQENVKDLKKGLGNVVGGGLKNPIGESAGELGDSLTSPFTGR